MRQCPTCGDPVPDGERFCSCGMDLGSGTPPSPSVVPSPFPPNPPPTQLSVVSPPPADQAPIQQRADPSNLIPPTPVIQTAAARITLKRGGVLTSEVFPIGDRVTVGRFDSESGPVDVDLGPLPESAYVSRHHADVWRDSGGVWYVKDLGSRNGTFVRMPGEAEFQRITSEQALVDGAEIALGNARFLFNLG